MDEQTFRDQAKRDGYADPVMIEREGGDFIESHAHDFSARILVLSGEMTVQTPEREFTCRVGEAGRVERGVSHSEQTGPDGVCFLVARKH